MARPTKQAHEKRMHRLPRPSVTTAELAYIEEQASNAGLSVVEYIRTLALTETVKPPRGKIDAGTLAELNKIGVNLNQIAHAVNAGRTDTALVTHAVNDVLRMMKKLDGVL